MIEEIEEQAKEYKKEKYCLYCKELRFCKSDCSKCDDTVIDFIAGAKWGIANAIQWHDLRKDPNDLPKKCNCYWGYVNYYGFQHREILWENNQFDVTGVIAWCELPQFKE